MERKKSSGRDKKGKAITRSVIAALETAIPDDVPPHEAVSAIFVAAQEVYGPRAVLRTLNALIHVEF